MKSILVGYIGRCPTTGKHSYSSKQAAKTSRRRLYPGQVMNVYPCGGGHWHVGHLPTAVKAGRLDRHQITRKETTT